jgi:hypothetical protein
VVKSFKKLPAIPLGRGKIENTVQRFVIGGPRKRTGDELASSAVKNLSTNFGIKIPTVRAPVRLPVSPSHFLFAKFAGNCARNMGGDFAPTPVKRNGIAARMSTITLGRVFAKTRILWTIPRGKKSPKEYESATVFVAIVVKRQLKTAALSMFITLSLTASRLITHP